MHSLKANTQRFLFLLMIFQMLLIMSVDFSFYRKGFKDYTENELQEDLKNLEKIAVKSLEISKNTSNEPEEFYNFVVDDLFTRIDYIKVVDRNGTTLARYGTFDPVQSAYKKPEVRSLTIDTPRLKEMTFLVYPKAYDSGTLHDNRNRFIKAIFREFLLLNMISLPLIYLISYYFIDRFTKGIIQYSYAISRLAEGDRSVQFPNLLNTRETRILEIAGEHLQEELKQKEAQMARRQQDLTHDLKGPIAGIFNQLEAIEAGALKLDGERFETFYRELGYVNTLIEDLGMMYELEDRNLQEKKTLQCCDELLDPILKRYEASAAEQGKIFKLDLQWDEVYGDAQLLQRALGNLLLNAIQHGQSGEILLRIFGEPSPDGFCTVFEIQNEGHIRDDLLPHIFTRYIRGSQDGRRGSGLGLSIARLISRMHGGELTAINRKDGTVVFRMMLPASKAEA